MKTFKLEVSRWPFVAAVLLFAGLAFAVVGGTGSFWSGENLRIKGTSSVTRCTLNGGSPSTCSVTVLAGAECVCSPVGITAATAAGGCAVSPNDGGVTPVLTSLNGSTGVVKAICF